MLAMSIFEFIDKPDNSYNVILKKKRKHIISEVFHSLVRSKALKTYSGFNLSTEIH